MHTRNLRAGIISIEITERSRTSRAQIVDDARDMSWINHQARESDRGGFAPAAYFTTRTRKILTRH